MDLLRRNQRPLGLMGGSVLWFAAYTAYMIYLWPGALDWSLGIFGRVRDGFSEHPGFAIALAIYNPWLLALLVIPLFLLASPVLFVAPGLTLFVESVNEVREDLRADAPCEHSRAGALSLATGEESRGALTLSRSPPVGAVEPPHPDRHSG